MKNLLFFLLFIFVYETAYSQNRKIDTKITQLFDIQYNYPDKSILLGNEIIQDLRTDDLQYSYALIGIGTSYGIKGNPDKAATFLLKAVEKAKSVDNEELNVNANLALAHNYLKMQLYDQANKSIKNAMKYVEKDSDPILKNGGFSRLYNQLAQSYDEKKDYDSSIINYKKAIYYAYKYEKIRKKNQNPAEFSAFYRGMGITYYNAGKIDSSENAFNMSLNFANENILVKNNEYLYNKIYADLFFGKIYFQRKEYKRAINTLHAALKQNAGKRAYIEAELLHTLASCYKVMGDAQNYAKYNDAYSVLIEKLTGEEKKALEESIKHEQLISEKQTKEKNQKIIYLVIGLVFISIFCSGIIYRLQRKKKKEKLFFQNVITKLENKLYEVDNSTAVYFPEEKQDLLEREHTERKGERQKTISEAVEKELLKKLLKFETSEKFTNPKLSLSLLASQLDTNSSYLSEVINKHTGKNYYNYINELRVDYICSKILKDSKYRNYKIVYLAEESGFSSHSVFATVFKNITGISPSTFIKQSEILKQNT